MDKLWIHNQAHRFSKVGMFSKLSHFSTRYLGLDPWACVLTRTLLASLQLNSGNYDFTATHVYTSNPYMFFTQWSPP